ncbi:MAG: MBL fold metallo-hydrolase [Thermodesulfobacteriota bacterium]|nr:MBL fold metallo-hydrolase [Thermodesulfobacteriota bacterium]
MPNSKTSEKSIEEIAKNFYLITLPMPFRLGHVNVIAFVHDKGVTLFDTGINLGDAFSRLEDSLKTINRSVRDIDRIFITHHHADHCGMAGRIKEISGAVIHMPEIGKQIIQNHKNERQVIDRIKEFYVEQGLTEKVVDTLTVLLHHFKKAISPFQVDECLDYHRKYFIGDTSFKAFPTPGHARDHVCFFFQKEGILLSGDHILPEITPNLSPDLFYPGFRPLQSFLDSLTSIQDLPVAKVFPAHGEPFSNLKKRIDEMREHHKERKSLIFNSVKKGPKTAFQVSQDIFGKDLSEFDKFLALNETYVHLVELIQEGTIKEYKSGKQTLYNIT